MYTRWYSQSVQAESFFRKLRKGNDAFDVHFKNVTAWVGSVIGIIAGLYLLLVLALTAANNENNANKTEMNTQRVVKAIGIGLGFCVLGGGITWFIVSSGNRRLRNRVFAFDDAIQKHDFVCGGNELLEDDYGIPLFHSVELPECPGKRLWAWICGTWKNDEFAWVQGGQLIDPVLRTLGENQALNIGIRMLGGRHASRENRLRQAGFEAIVFSEELNLPDIILGHRQIFETSYVRKAVQEYALPLPGIPGTAFSLWGAVSDQRGTADVYGALADIVNSRHCLIEVIGGRVVVFLNSFLGWESELVGSLKDVERELDFAHSIFQRLRLVSQAADPSVKTQPDAEAVADAFKSRGNFRPKLGFVAVGLCVAAFGGLGLLGAASLKLSPDLANTSTTKIEGKKVDARVVKRGITRGPDHPDGSKGSTARPWISYSYKIFGESFKTKESLCDDYVDIGEARKMARGYSNGESIKAWIVPSNPDISALKRENLEDLTGANTNNSKLKDVNLGGVIAFGFFTMCAGLGLVAFGFLAGRHKVVVPEFSQSPSRSAVQRVGNRDRAAATNRDTTSPLSLDSAKYFEQQPTGILD